VIFEGLARVKPSSSDVRIYCDLFLVQFSNIAMRGEMKDISLKPLIAMVLSNSRHIRDANAIDVVRHLAAFFESDIAEEASKQLAHLEEILNTHANKEVLIERLPTLARKRLERSGLKREEYLENIEVLVNILQWQGRPTCRLSHNYTKYGEDITDKWKKEDPREHYTNKSRITAKESRNGYIYIAKRKADRVPVTIKVMTKWKENEKQIKKEVALLHFMNQCEGFTKLFDVFLYEDEVWAIVEYCDAGNMVDFIPVAVMSEAEIAYVVKELLQSLQFLHKRNRMHRDLTTDDILLNMCGDVLLADFEMWMGASTQRFWLSPELLLAEPYPYGPEVDIWSLGCIMMEMADGYPPYSDLHPIKEFFYTATRGAPPLARPNKWSKEFRWFLESCLHPDPTKRASAERLLGDPWLKKACTREQFSDIVRERVSWTRW